MKDLALPSLLLALLWTSADPAWGQTTTRVSVGTGGAQGDLDSYEPALSATGRLVAFSSLATNLVPGDTNGWQDVFVHDRGTGVTTRVSVNSSGVQAHWPSYGPVLSADGRCVAFYSGAGNLVPDDTNGVYDVFVHDRRLGTTERVSKSSGGLEGDGASYYPSLSADGRFVSFHSDAANLVARDTNGVTDIFVRDRLLARTTRVSVTSAGVQADDRSSYAAICADGSRVAFVSWASNLAAGDVNGSPDAFVHDLTAGTTTCVSVDASGVPGDGGCSYPAISGDGNVVGFESWSENLVPGDTNGVTDSFVRDLATGVTTRVSVDSSGVQGNDLSLRAVPSFDGRYVAFKSQASNLVPNDTNGFQDIFLRDRRTGRTIRVNVGAGLQQAAGQSSQPALSADGRHVGFYSWAANLVPGDTNGAPDVFVRD